MKARLIVLSVLCMSVFAGSAMAEEAEGKKGETQGRKCRGAERFKAADTDGNGSLSLAEFKVIRAKHVARIKEKLGDRFDPEKAKERPSDEEVFAKIDGDESGGLSPQEMKKAHQHRKQRRQQGNRGQRGRNPENKED